MSIPKSAFQNMEWLANNAGGVYQAANQDISNATYQYYGFVTADGNWRIQRFHIIGSAIIYEYAQGSSILNYSACWDANGLYVGGLTFVSFDLLK